MTKNRKQRPARLGAVLLILAMAAALLSSSALAAPFASDVYETITQGENAYVELTYFSEYTVYTYELCTGSGPPGMDFLESGDTVGLAGTPTQAGTYTGTGIVYYQSNEGEADEPVAFSFTITVEAAEKTEEPINQNTHDHIFHSEWSYDEEAHWHNCDCGSRDGYEPHRVSGGSLSGVCEVCGARISSADDRTAASETPEATLEAAPDGAARNTPEAKEKPALGSGREEMRMISVLTVVLVVLVAVLLLLLGVIVFFILRGRSSPESEAYHPRHDGIRGDGDRQEYERRKSAGDDDSEQ